MFNRKGTATCNCLIDVLSKLLLKTSIRHWKATGCRNNLVYHTPSTSNQENKNKSRQRNVIWFNPPYSKSVATRISQSFLHLIDTLFPKIHIFNKIFNRNKVKVSYDSMQNIKGITNNHNMNILHQNNEIKDECNCRNKKYYPLGGKCLSPNTV